MVDAWRCKRCCIACLPSFGSRSTFSEKPEDEAVVSAPPCDVVDDPDVDVDPDVVLDIVEEPEVVDPDVVDVSVVVSEVEPEASVDGAFLEEDSSGAAGSSASCIRGGTE